MINYCRKVAAASFGNRGEGRYLLLRSQPRITKEGHDQYSEGQSLIDGCDAGQVNQNVRHVFEVAGDVVRVYPGFPGNSSEQIVVFLSHVPERLDGNGLGLVLDRVAVIPVVPADDSLTELGDGWGCGGRWSWDRGGRHRWFGRGRWRDGGRSRHSRCGWRRNCRIGRCRGCFVVSAGGHKGGHQEHNQNEGCALRPTSMTHPQSLPAILLALPSAFLSRAASSILSRGKRLQRSDAAPNVPRRRSLRGHRLTWRV